MVFGGWLLLGGKGKGVCDLGEKKKERRLACWLVSAGEI